MTHSTLKHGEQFEIKASSFGLSKLIHYGALKANIPTERVSRSLVPFELLNVGFSFWINLDVTDSEDWRNVLANVRMRNKNGPQKYATHKHRGDLRKSGFKYLEIARIK